MIRQRFQLAPNRLLPLTLRSIRATDEFDSARLLRSPFITLWTASWCSTCKTVQPLIRELIEKQGAGASDSASVGYAEVELDAPTIADVAMRYQLTSVPTLLSFRMGEPHMDTRVTDAAKLADKAFLIKWIEEEARNGGSMGNKGKSLFGGFFGA